MSFSAATNSVELKELAMRSAHERYKIKTGYCLHGFHEGTKPRDGEGKALKTCPKFDTCPCKCHIELDELFEMSGKQRILVENPDYVPPPPIFSFTRDTIPAPSVLDANPVIPANTLVSAAPGIVPGAVPREYKEMPSGRNARGQLEGWVKEVCDTWVIENDRHPCTPQFIAEQIAQSKAIEVPQRGGIIHVFERWVEMGFAEIAQSPYRFLRYTPDAIEVGLDGMRERYKRAKKFQTNQQGLAF